MDNKNVARYSLLLFVFVFASIPCFAQEASNSKVNSSTSAQSSTTVQDEKQWQRYTGGGEEFSVLMPEQPFMDTFTRPQQRGDDSYEKLKEMKIYGSYSEGAVYLVMSFANSKRKEPVQVFIEEFPRYPVFQNGMTFERDTELNGFKGKQYRITSDFVHGIVQFYQTNKHIYIFYVAGDSFGKPSAEQFLSSLTLDGKTKGKDIAEGFKQAYPTIPPTISTPSPNGATGRSPNQNETFAPKEVTRKAIIIFKAEPKYTEEARRNSISGTVVLKGVFSASGKVTNIRVVSGLPNGLTEKAISAASLLKFIPPIKEGRYVSQYIQIEYNFNLY
jgi:TonB family protein